LVRDEPKGTIMNRELEETDKNGGEIAEGI
jgi:hypothetical protein